MQVANVEQTLVRKNLKYNIMNIKSAFIILIAVLISNIGFAQKEKTNSKENGKMEFHVKDAKDKLVYLTITYREKLMLVDSTPNNGKGVFVFTNTKEYKDGLYSLVSESKKLYLSFIVDNDYDFSVYLDTTADIRNVRYEDCQANQLMLEFQLKNIEMSQKMRALSQKREMFTKTKQPDSVSVYANKIQEINTEMMNFIDDYIHQNPTYLFSKLQKTYQEIDIPEAPTLPDGTKDQLYQYNYYKVHFWDHFDLTDSRTIYLPSFEPKLKEYFEQVLIYQEIDTINKYIDLTLSKTTDTLVYRFCVEWLSYHFETSKTIGHDGVFVHLVKENQLKDKCYWMDEEILSKYEKRVRKLEPLLIGKHAVELIIPDTTQTDDYTQWISSHKLPYKFVILWFYDPGCGTCKKESKKLKQLYDSVSTAGTRNFEVYGVSSEADIDRWKKYLNEQQFSWVNVGGLKANIDYLDIYNIYELGNPQMYILNEKRDIILNKRIDMMAIPQFLEQYEKREKEKSEGK